MRILGIESSTSVCAAAVVDGDGVRAERILDAEQMHSERLVILIDEVLGDASLTVRELDGIAVSIGPGSFTGLRIGLSVAKGLAYAAGIPIVAVPTLEALAYHAVRSMAAREGDLVAPMIDARRNELYAALYEVHSGSCRAVMAAEDGDAAALVSRITGDRRTVLCGNGTAKFLKAAGDTSRYTLADVGGCSAASVALLGRQRLASGAADDLASLEPLYIKEFSSTAHL